MAFKSDEILWYNNGVWGELGYACPNFGDNPATLNSGIHSLVSSVGRNISGVMCRNPDVDLRKPPEIGTLTRIHKLVIRARQIIGGRVIPSGKPSMEAVHASPAPTVFIIYPVPYFKVRNSWLKEYCGLALLALSEAMQHTDNLKSFDFGENLAGLVGQYLQRIYTRMCTELFGLPPDKVTPDYVLSDADLAAYNPAKWFTSTEIIDTIPTLDHVPTEDDLVPLTDGIPATMLVGLQHYPAGLATEIAPTTAGSAGTTGGTATAPAFPAAPTP